MSSPGGSSYRSYSRESTFELDLAPMLALMVSIIPLLLLNASFGKMSVIESPLPQVVLNPTKAETESADKKPSAVMILNVLSDMSVKWTILVNGKEENVLIKSNESKVNFDLLKIKSEEIKSRFKDVTKVDLNPHINLSYDHMVKMMDTLRGVGKETMFPQVILSNIVEGGE